MQEETININEIVKIESLPKIYYQLEKVGMMIDKNLENVESMECTEENKQEVKAKRAEIKKISDAFESKRKELKNSILESYNLFEDKYKNEVKNKLDYADKTLKDKIVYIEDQQKKQKEDNIREFAEEYFENYDIEKIVKFEDIGLNINLSTSEKSLKEQVISFCEKISNDMKLIALEEFRDEITFEYKKTFNFADAKINVINRHREIENIRNIDKEVTESKEQEKVIEETVDKFITPEEITDINKQELYTLTFTIKDVTKEQIVKIKNLLREEGIKYE